MSAPDPTLVPIFEAEVAEIVGTLQAHLLRLEQGAPDAASLLSDMLRLTHDIKGSARVVGYQHVSKLAHAFESRLMLWRGVALVSPEEIGLALAACDQLSQLTNGREAPELVARAIELARTLEDRSKAPADPAERPALPAPAPAATGAAPSRTRAPAMRILNNVENLRVPRLRIESVVDGVADVLVSALASTDRLTELEKALRELQGLRPPRAGASPRERDRARGEWSAAVQRMRDAVRHMAEALRPLDHDLRMVDERARDLCLVPSDQLVTHLERVARDTAALLGRELAFTVEGREILIDKQLSDAVKGPLAHAVRNAVDHGLETPDERERAGKPRAGALTLRLVEEGQSLRLTLSDDGRGIDRPAVRARLGAAAEGLDDRELLAALLHAGVSTRETVTEISGRGVGLGSLVTVTRDLRGDVELNSEPQLGTSLELRLPIKVSLFRGLLVRAGGGRFIVPESALVSVRTPCPTAAPLAPVPLASLLGLPLDPSTELVVLRGRSGVAGLLVERVEGLREIVRRPLGNHLGRVRFVEGVTILGDGEPALILDPREVAEACPQVSQATADSPEPQAAPPASPSAASLTAPSNAPSSATPPGSTPARARGRRVLLVDDSLTVRVSLGHALTAAGFEVALAEDGQAALEQLGRSGCDAIVSDVQMPRLDGWQLLQRCAHTIPFVLMTARPEPDGASRARQSGACAYLAKDDALAARVVAALHTALSQLLESLP